MNKYATFVLEHKQKHKSKRSIFNCTRDKEIRKLRALCIVTSDTRIAGGCSEVEESF